MGEVGPVQGGREAMSEPELREHIASAIEELADDLDWDGFIGAVHESREHAQRLLHRAAAIARGDA